MQHKLLDERMDIIESTALVAEFFGGDAKKTIHWFKTSNPLLGDFSPSEMIGVGSHAKLLKFVKNSLANNPKKI